MSHVRQQIREAFGNACSSLSIVPSSNVFQSRTYPVEVADLPAVCIYTLTESSDDIEIGGASRLISRVMPVKVEAYARSASNVDDTLDTIASEVEIAVANSSTIDALVT